MRSERQLVVTVAREFVGGDGKPNGWLSRGQSVDWEIVLNQAQAEGLAGLLAHQAGTLTRCPREVSQALEHAAEATFVANASALRQLDGLGREFARRGLEAIVLKGGALLHSVYRDHLHIRPLSDLDVLVRQRDRGAVDAALRGLGYVTHATGSALYVGAGLMIDVHDDLMGTARIRRRAFACQFDEATVWGAARPLTPTAQGLRRLSPTFEALHLAVHAFRHGFARLIWLVDLALVSPRLDAVALVGAAWATGTHRALACAAAALQGLLGISIAGEGRRLLPRLGLAERAFLRAVIRRRRVERVGELLLGASISGVGARLGYVRELLFPEADVLAGDHPGTRPWLRGPKRLARLAASGMREGFNLLPLGRADS